MSAIPDDESRRRMEQLMARDKRLLRELQEAAASIKSQGTQRLSVNKRTHRVRFENETEDQVTIVIEPRGE